MTGADVVIVVGAVALIGFLVWYFFGPKQVSHAVLRDGVQEVEVTVRGGYAPDVIRVRQGVPVRLLFDRREGGECTSHVVFPDFGVNKALPAYGKANVELTPETAGDFGFACGMNMVHGRLIVEPAMNGDGQPVSARTTAEAKPIGATAEAEPVAAPAEADSWDVEAAGRRAEISDLSRRVLVGTLLTLPVVFAREGRALSHAASEGGLVYAGPGWGDSYRSARNRSRIR